MRQEFSNAAARARGRFDPTLVGPSFEGFSGAPLSLDFVSQGFVSQGLAQRIVSAPRDKLLTIINAALSEYPENLGTILDVFRAEADAERKEDLYRAIRSACANCPSVFLEYKGEAESAQGFRSRLTIIAVPLEARRGAGLLTDFHLISQLCLGKLGDVRALPLPSRFPVPRAPTLASIADYPGPSSELFKPQDFGKIEFGRSTRFTPQSAQILGDTSFQPVLKASRGTESEALSNLQFEAAVMDYLRQHQRYFGLESEIPIPKRGPSNRVAAWSFEGQNHLYYGASAGYFNYLDELTSAEDIAECGSKVVRDLMRLARFGIFHTEPAPIFHSVAQQRRFLWNVGGLLPGAGDLEYWQESFGHSNFRQSGIADFEHFRRWRSMPAVVSIVNDTEEGPSLGFQYHLGNALFCGIHVMALGYHRLGKSFSDYPEVFRRVMKDAYQAFTGSEWVRYEDDVDEATVLEELGTLGTGPHVGEFSGSYPHQNFIKALYAFTLRAIPDFVSARPSLRQVLPSKEALSLTGPLPQPHLPHSVPDFVLDIKHLLEELHRSSIIAAIVEAGLPEMLQTNFIYGLRGGDLAKVRTSPESAPRIAIKARAIVRLLKELLPAENAGKVISALAPFDPNKVGRHVLPEDPAEEPDGWCF